MISDYLLANQKLLNHVDQDVYKRQAKFLQLPRTDIGGHNDNRILEIDGSAIIVSQTAFIQYLEQDVEYVRMGFQMCIRDSSR